MRKTTFYLALAGMVFFSVLIQAQTTFQFDVDQPSLPLTVDAGDDQEFDEENAVILGGQPTASGADGNYTYLWTPAEFLDDPTLPNPEVVGLTMATTFSVTVTADGALCEKTAEVFVDYVSGVMNQSSLSSLRAYPNPFTDQVRFEAEAKVQSVLVYDLAGNLVLTRERIAASNGLIDATELAPGMYFFAVDFLNGEHKTLRLCKLQ